MIDQTTNTVLTEQARRVRRAALNAWGDIWLMRVLVLPYVAVFTVPLLAAYSAIVWCVPAWRPGLRRDWRTLLTHTRAYYSDKKARRYVTQEKEQALRPPWWRDGE